MKKLFIALLLLVSIFSTPVALAQTEEYRFGFADRIGIFIEQMVDLIKEIPSLIFSLFEDNKEPAPTRTPDLMAPTSTNPTATSATDPNDPQAPVIESISPGSGPVGTVITLKGRNLAGFEGDLDAWIENDQGEQAYLGQFGTSVYPRTDQITARIEEQVCRENNSYSGNPCASYLTITPGTYKIFTQPWGKKSNVVEFMVTSDSSPE